jgi:hypothetical protein
MRIPSSGSRALSLAATAALLCGSLAAQTNEAPAAPREEISIGWRPSADETRPRYATSVDPVAGLMGWPLLRDPGALGGARREVRLWMGFGIGSPDLAMRVVDGPGGASGEVVLWWPGEAPAGETFLGSDSERNEWAALRRGFAQRMRADLASAGCTESRRTVALETCRFTVPESPDWGAILARIDQLDAWTLANPATLQPPMRGGGHGSTLVVEVRDGERYRSYAYWSPSRFPHVPEARRADALAHLFHPFLAKWQELMMERMAEQERERQARAAAEGTP